MIKVNINNAKEIKHKHLNGLKAFVETNIEEQISKATDPHLKNFLKFLKCRVATLLCGERSELQRIITIIEKRYYISKGRLRNIIDNRSKEADGRKPEQVIKENLLKYSRGKHLYRHLPSTVYNSIHEFDAEANKLIDKWKDYRKILDTIFDYGKFSEGKLSWSAYELVSHLGVSVCPYCNRSYVTTLVKEKKGDKQTRAELDHYYPKSRYPYLALSFNNLIPSCSVCNGSLKGTVDFYEEDAIYPYEEEFLNVASFKTDFNDNTPYDYRYLLGISKEFKIIFEIDTADKELEKRVEKAIKSFALDRLYNTHQDYVKDLIRNAIVNNNSRIDEIYGKFPDIFNSREEVMQSVFLNYMSEEDLGKRPLSKLTQDICKELGLLNIVEKQIK